MDLVLVREREQALEVEAADALDVLSLPPGELLERAVIIVLGEPALVVLVRSLTWRVSGSSIAPGRTPSPQRELRETGHARPACPVSAGPRDTVGARVPSHARSRDACAGWDTRTRVIPHSRPRWFGGTRVGEIRRTGHHRRRAFRNPRIPLVVRIKEGYDSTLDRGSNACRRRALDLAVSNLVRQPVRHQRRHGSSVHCHPTS